MPITTTGTLKVALIGKKADRSLAAETVIDTLVGAKATVKRAGTTVAQGSITLTSDANDQIIIQQTNIVASAVIDPTDADLVLHCTNAGETGGFYGPIDGQTFTLSAPTTVGGTLRLEETVLTVETTEEFTVTEANTGTSAQGFTYGDPAPGFVYSSGTVPAGFKGQFEGHNFSTELVTPSNPVRVPKEFFGMHTDGPGVYTPRPSYVTGAERSHDAYQIAGPQASTTWAYIDFNRPSGGARRWEGMDLWYAEHSGKGKLLSYNFFYTPPGWEQYSTARRKYPFAPNGPCPPSAAGLAGLTEFAAALSARYPEIQMFEVWNEPNFNWNSTALAGDESRQTNAWMDANYRPDQSPFFTGTPNDLADITKAISDGLPAGKFLASPGWEGQTSNSPSNAIRKYFLALANKGYTNLITHANFHHYTYDNDPHDTLPHIRSIKAVHQSAGVGSLFLVNTEQGAEAPIRLANVGDDDKERHIKRWAIGNAIEGILVCFIYKWSADNLANPANNQRVRDSLLWVSTELPGSTIYQAAFLADNTYWIRYVKDGDNQIKEVRI